MPDKPAPPAGPQPSPDKPSVYGGRWGPGAAPTPHNKPGTVGADPTSAPARGGERTPSPRGAADRS